MDSLINLDQDHSKHHTSDTSTMMMKMFFHGGYQETILFSFWQIDSVGGLIGSMVAIFIIAVFYEGLKFSREILIRRSALAGQQQRRRRSSRAAAFISREEANDESAGLGPGTSSSIEAAPGPDPHESSDSIPLVQTFETKLFSVIHVQLTFLFLIQMTLAYALMLIVMTFNSWLCLATLLGATFGYFLFGWRRSILLEDTEMCH